MDVGSSAFQSSWGVSLPVNIAAGKCTRCGRATEPGNICGSCQGSHHSAGPSSTTTTVNHCQLTTVAAACTTCCATVRVPSHYRFETDHVLCPPCQVRYTPTVKPDSLVYQVNPYPVVMPMPKTTVMPHALALTVAFTYPQYRDAVPSAASASSAPPVASYRRDPPRVCMRFGCGERIPVHVLGDICEACVRAGFVRPPPAFVPSQSQNQNWKGMQGRVAEHPYPRLRESFDVVRTSSLQEVARPEGTCITATEGADVEDEDEVDLMYPDDEEDVSVATPCPTTSESNREEFKLTEDEDDDLNLVYPDDAAETVCVSQSKPQTRLSQPTTLRELFRKEGLQNIPFLHDLTALVGKDPPRHCRMPGCNEVLPVQTSMKRCVRCGINDWKRRRRLSTMAALDPSRRPSTISFTTTTTMEEEEVAAMVVDMSDVEQESDTVSPSSSPSKSSSDELTGDRSVRPIPGWDSDLTELSNSDSDTEDASDSDSDSGPDETLCKPKGETSGLKIHIPLLVTRLPPDTSLQKCGNKKCNIAVPKDHRWKTCEPCRRAQRMYQRMRFENIRRSVLGLETLRPPGLPCRRWRSLSPEMYENDAPLTLEVSRPCSAKRCRNRIPLPEVYQWKTCVRCRARARRKARRQRDARLAAQKASRQLEEVVPRFPAYQNRGALLASFDRQLKGFIEGKIMYLRAKLPAYAGEGGDHGKDNLEQWNPENAPMMFVFVGEHSVVTGQRDDSEGGDDNHVGDHAVSSNNPADLDAMRQEVLSMVLELERVLRATFRAGEAFSIDNGGIIMQFTCTLQLIAQLRPLETTAVGSSSAPGSEVQADKDKDNTTVTFSEDTSLTPNAPRNTVTPAVPLVKTLSGELEAVVVPDESHHLFHGRRVVVRYRMVG